MQCGVLFLIQTYQRVFEHIDSLNLGQIVLPALHGLVHMNVALYHELFELLSEELEQDVLLDVP